ncbi:MAG: diaminopimelate epimerase [Deltaproteobacteria bacterium]|nr:diaminopimelate epimerase [Deltaproteobacteria bacterium]
MSPVRFAKYHGLGNDFVLVDRLEGGEPILPEEAVRLCERRRGIGADGVLTLLPARGGGAARMHVTNADGSVAQMCGNGIRCVAKYLADQRGLVADELSIDTDAGLRSCRLMRHAGKVEEVIVDMGRPELEAARIPMRVSPGQRFLQQELSVPGATIKATAISMGNPHLVLFDVVEADAPGTLGPVLERHPLFPERTNVEFAQRLGDGLAVTVWERGAGLTEACGTGACAAMVAAVLEARLPGGEERPVRLKGGELQVRVEADLSRVWMRGPARRVFEGEI